MDAPEGNDRGSCTATTTDATTVIAAAVIADAVIAAAAAAGTRQEWAPSEQRLPGLRATQGRGGMQGEGKGGSQGRSCKHEVVTCAHVEQLSCAPGL